MIIAMDEMIEEARKMARSQRIRASERIRWTRLAGQLIWYKDSILKNKTYEALEVEVWMLKEQVHNRAKDLTRNTSQTISSQQQPTPTANKTKE